MKSITYFTETSVEAMSHAASVYFFGPLDEPYSDHPHVRLDISSTPKPISKSCCRASCTLVCVTEITDEIARQAIADALGVEPNDINITRDEEEWLKTAPPTRYRSNDDNVNCAEPPAYLANLHCSPDRYLPRSYWKSRRG